MKVIWPNLCWQNQIQVFSLDYEPVCFAFIKVDKSKKRLVINNLKNCQNNKLKSLFTEREKENRARREEAETGS